jgi:hypothetical protein
MPSSTLELRWFFSGPLEESGSGMEVWFTTRPRYGRSGRATPIAWDPTPPAWRQDRYLLVPGSDEIGIKWRVGRLEIKGRVSTLRLQMLAPGIAGACEHWLKWSYAGDAIDRRFHDLFENGLARGVVSVEKRRLQRYLNLSSTGTVDEVRPNDRRKRGINIELAEIRVPGPPCHLHWSLAFEAFPSEQVSEFLAQIVASFLAGCPALPLSADQSMSYPRWLLAYDRSSGP